MRIFHWIAAAVVLGATVGCDTAVTEKKVSDQRDVVADRQARVDKLEEEKSREIQQAADEARAEKEAEIARAKEELKEEREQYVALQERQEVEGEMEAKLAALDKKIDEVEDRAAKAEGEEKVELEKKAAELQARYDNHRKELDELKAASGDTWAKMKLSLEEGWEDMTQEINAATDDSDET
jgi:hypothetical protein